MPKFTKAQIKAAKALAVRYAAWVDADDDSGRIVWGTALLQSVAEFPGIGLVDVEMVERIVHYARRREAAKVRDMLALQNVEG
jgi:hypothetical protein